MGALGTDFHGDRGDDDLGASSYDLAGLGRVISAIGTLPHYGSSLVAESERFSAQHVLPGGGEDRFIPYKEE